MCKSIDLKSVVIGGLIVAVVACAVGAVGYGGCNEYERFELVTTPSFALLLDRATGQVWAMQIDYPDNVIVSTPHGDEEFFAPKVPGPTTASN